MKQTQLILLLATLLCLCPCHADNPSGSKLILSARITNQATGKPVPGANVSITIFNQQRQKVGGPYRRMTDGRGYATQELSIHGKPRKFYGHYAQVAFYAAGYQHKNTQTVRWDPSKFKPQGANYVNKASISVELIPENVAQINNGNDGVRADLRQISGSRVIQGLRFTVQYNQMPQHQLQSLINQLKKGGMVHVGTLRDTRAARSKSSIHTKYNNAYIAARWLRNNVQELNGYRFVSMDTGNMQYEQRQRTEDLKLILP